ncbi:MAG TPA: LuxR C-terminal-related transcriptional regulator [Allocoleopsis sp.]
MEQLLCHAAEREIHPKYVRRLLTAFGSVEGKASTNAQPLIEPLSERELEVLRYLASGLSNQAICASQQRFAIADKLFISLATAKWHVRNIYGKLNQRGLMR